MVVFVLLLDRSLCPVWFVLWPLPFSGAGVGDAGVVSSGGGAGRQGQDKAPYTLVSCQPPLFW